MFRCLPIYSGANDFPPKFQSRIGTALCSLHRTAMAASAPPPEPQNQLSALVFDISNGAKEMMENMLKMISEVNENSDVIEEEIEKCKDSALQRKRTLDEEKEQFQKAAFAVLDLLSKND